MMIYICVLCFFHNLKYFYLYPPAILTTFSSVTLLFEASGNNSVLQNSYNNNDKPLKGEELLHSYVWRISHAVAMGSCWALIRCFTLFRWPHELCKNTHPVLAWLHGEWGTFSISREQHYEER